MTNKPQLSFQQIVNMNVGFFGLQYSFGLQQSNMSPLYNYLGADEAALPLLWLAGPMTGLLVQPFIGAMSDRTVSRWGRRTPYFLIGAIICSLALVLMPFSPALWVAASLLWILDAANNVTMEPYRAFVSDKLDGSQQASGFLTQSAMTGLGQTLSYLTPSLLVLAGMNAHAVNAHNIPHITIAAFLIGAVFSLSSMLWTLRTTREIPLDEAARARLLALPHGFRHMLSEIAAAFREMPPTMRRLAPVMLLQWYAMFCYWQYIVLSISRSLFGTTDPHSDAFRDAVLINGQLGAFYNFVAFFAAFAMIPFSRRFGAGKVHSICLAVAGLGMLAIPQIREQSWLFVAVIGVGLAWGSIMGNPYTMLSASIPPERTGVYMGIFNMFIVVPMMIQIATLPLYYRGLLGGDPSNVISLAGILMLGAALAMLRVQAGQGAGRPLAPQSH